MPGLKTDIFVIFICLAIGPKSARGSVSTGSLRDRLRPIVF